MGARYHLVHLCIVLATCFNLAEHATAGAKCRARDKSALLSFKKTFVADPTPPDPECVPYTWDENADCCSWNGIECHSNTGSVISIRLANICDKGTSATFSSNSSLFQLSSLQSLDLTSVDLQQSAIPSEIEKLRNLRILYLGYSNLRGTIPDAVGSLTQLQYLSLFDNDLWGSIPLSFSKLKNLKRLDISTCKLTGSIPGALFNNPNLEDLHLEWNQLTGSLPAAISGPSSLSYMDLSRNHLEGAIPAWLFEIPSLFYLLLSNNSFGPLQTFLNPEKTSLDHIDLSFNKINGPFPSSLFHLATVTSLNLRANQLTGAVQWNSFKNMVNLSSLDLSENRGLTLKNTNGAPVNLQRFAELQIASCSVTEFPRFLSSFKSLLLLDVSDNKISGPVLMENGWEQLMTFNGSHNQITAFKFPKAGHVYMFDLSYNLIKGRLPITIPSSSMGELHLSNNKLTGGIPAEYCKFLAELDLSYNNLVGVLPSCFNTSEYLRLLHLQNNHFNGVIPSTIGNINMLRSLDLSKNQLGGRIPPSIMSLKLLEYLNLSYNNLVGPIPQGKFPGASYIGNPGLCGPPLSRSC